MRFIFKFGWAFLKIGRILKKLYTFFVNIVTTHSILASLNHHHILHLGMLTFTSLMLLLEFQINFLILLLLIKILFIVEKIGIACIFWLFVWRPILKSHVICALLFMW